MAVTPQPLSVMTDDGIATFSPEQLQSMLTLAQKGLKELASLQTAFLTKQLLAR